MTDSVANNGKPRVAFYWCASCGGCEEAVVDLAEKILDVVAAVDIVFWPVALDFKRADVEAMPDASVLASFINGAIRTSEQRDGGTAAKEVVFGSCIRGLRPAWRHSGIGEPLRPRRGILATVYFASPSTVHEPNPGCDPA